MKAWIVLAPLAILTMGAAPDAPRNRYLASIEGIALGPDEYIEAFSIDTWGVGIEAVCHIPPGWRINAGSSAAPDGIIAGEGSHGVTFLNRKDIGQLRGLVLITLDGPVRRADIGKEGSGERLPATFKGSASIGTYGKDSERRAQLTYANVRLQPARGCPTVSER